MRALLFLLCASVPCGAALFPAGVARAAPPPGRPAPAPGAPGAPLAPVVREAQIDRVVVYSDQARVFRTARVTVGGGSTRAILAALPAAVRPDTVRVECDSAAIVNVEVTRTWERLPRQAEARALLAKIEQVVDQIRTLADEQRLLRTELNLVEALQPVAQRPKPDKEPPHLFVDAWRKVLGWAEGRAARARARLGAIPAQRYALGQQLHALQIEGRKLLPDAAAGPALRVAVTLRGPAGAHRVELSYAVGGVRWVPSYDLRYDPVNPAVEASYYALVSQSSGEDWRGARLSFSTIMPSNLVAVPELPTWILGKKTSFTPRPRERWEPAPGAWVPPQATPRGDPIMDRLEATIRQSRASVDLPPEVAGRDEDKDGVADAEDAKKEAPAKAAEAPPPPPMPQGRPTRTYTFRDDTIDGSLVRPAPAAAGPRVMAETVAVSGRRRAVSAPMPTEELPWTDTGYRPPELDPDLPAASAKGHRFTMDAPGRHTVVANGTAVRVPLLRERFRVTPVYRVVPGRSKAAYLTAEIYNSSGRPVLRGHANLFTGATYSGQTMLETAVPGGKLLLPLGVDEGVKVNRTIDQRTVATGIVFKDDTSEYTVTIEIANHRRHEIQVELEDQVPVRVNNDVKVEGFEASPAMSGPELDGKVTWKGSIGAGSVRKLTFKFRLVRPKNWELQQHDG